MLEASEALIERRVDGFDRAALEDGARRAM
jgi:hypothetical protein